MMQAKRARGEILEIRSKKVNKAVIENPVLNALLFSLGSFLSKSEIYAGDDKLGDDLLQNIGGDLLNYLKLKGQFRIKGRDPVEVITNFTRFYADQGLFQRAELRFGDNSVSWKIWKILGWEAFAEASNKFRHQEVRACPIIAMILEGLRRIGYLAHVTELGFDRKTKACLAKIEWS